MKSSVLALIGLVVVGGGVYLLTRGGSAVPSGDALLGEMYAEAMTANSVNYVGTVDFSGSKTGQVGRVHADFSGASMSGGTSSQAKLNVNVTGESGQGEEKMTFAGALELLGFDREAYLRVAIGEETLAQVPFAATVNNRWIRISIDELSDTGLFPPEALEQINNSANLGDVVKFKEIMLSHKILEAVSIEDGENIGGEDTYHITLSINEDELIAAMNDWALYLNQPAIADADAAEMRTGIEKFEQYADMEIWVGQDSKLPRKYTLVADVPNSVFKTEAATESAGTEAIKFSMELTMSGFNEPVEVVAPAESVSIMELLSPLVGGMLGGAFAQ